VRRYTIEVDGRPFVVDVEDEAADRFYVEVDGQAFDVTLGSAQELTSGEPAPRIVPVARPAPVAAGAPPSAPSRPPPSAGGGGTTLGAPMPGVILRLQVVAGARVERGQDLAVLEAMKMENVIRAPHAGLIAEVCVQPGDKVGHGQPIVRFAAEG
jgi:biotin carboxyl carrier protein